MSINERLFGLNVLRGGETGDGSVDIVAIHGMAADPERTWTTRRYKDNDSKTSEGGNVPAKDSEFIDWLKDESMLPRALPKARIMRFGYKSESFGAGQGNLVRASEVADRLLMFLHSKRTGSEQQDACTDRPIILFGHSFGGLVAIQLVSSAYLKMSQYPGIFQSIVGIVTFGAPFRGTDTSLGGTPRDLSWLLQQAETVHRRVYSENYEIFRPGNYNLLDMVENYRHTISVASKPRMLCVYETKETDISRWPNKEGGTKDNEAKYVRLVNEHSGTMDADADTFKLPRSCDHIAVSKFSFAEDSDYEYLRLFLVETIKKSKDLIAKRKQKLRTTIHASDVDAITNQRDEIMAWLSNSTNAHNQNLQINRRNRLLEKHEPGTGEWLFKRQEYIDWVRIDAVEDAEENRHNVVLWLHGKPAAGKSVLVAQVAKAIIPVIAIYCEYDNRSYQTLQSLLCSAILQVIPYLDISREIPKELLIMWMKYKYQENSGYLPAVEGASLLTELVQRLDKCYIILDGLDEYDEQGKEGRSRSPIDLLEVLHRVTLKCRGRCRLLVASRDDVYHENAWLKRSNIEVVANRADIAKYVTARVDDRKFSHYDGLSKPENAWLRNKIVETLCESANGIFMIPFMQLEIIKEQTNLRSVNDSLETLPENLFKLYRLALERICELTGTGEESGLRIVEVVLCAARRLHIHELQHALATRKGDVEFNRLGLTTPIRILSQTGSLISIDKNNLVQFQHHTVDEYLVTDDVFKEYFSTGFLDLMEKCRTYISFKALKAASHNIASLKRDYSFLEYASLYYGHHMAQCIKKKQLVAAEAFRFLDDRDKMPLAPLQVVASRILTIPSADRMPVLVGRSSILHLAILWNIEPVVQKLVRGTRGNILDQPGFKDQRPLHYAARCLDISATWDLLLNSVDVNATEVEGRTPLDLILTRPWRDAQLHVNDRKKKEFLRRHVGDLLKNAPSKLPGGSYTLVEQVLTEVLNQIPRVVPRASAEDVIEELRRLKRPAHEQEKLADLIIRTLHIDMDNDGESIAIMLIQQGADVNSLDVEETSPLQLAALYGRKNLVKTLLDHNANPFLTCSMGSTAVEIAVKRAAAFDEKRVDYSEIVQLILAKMDLTIQEEKKLFDEREKKNLPGPAQAVDIEARKVNAYEEILSRIRPTKFEPRVARMIPGSWDDAW